jgi:Mg2+ and Co2+ transporter CorA
MAAESKQPYAPAATQRVDSHPIAEISMNSLKPKAARRKAKTARLTMTNERAAEILAELLKRSVDRASRALDKTHREAKRSTRRIAAMEKAQKDARRKREAGKPRTVLSPLERELIDYLTRYADKQFQAMAKRLDRTNRRLDEVFARVDWLKAKKLPSLRKFRGKARTKKPATASSRLLRPERGRR